jgi:hypothetical protein
MALHQTVGWGMILAGMLVGGGLGLFFHREDFWGGYASFRRRIVRLGHVALIALGMLNILFAFTSTTLAIRSPNLAAQDDLLSLASRSLLAGSLMMPAVCFLTGWRKGFRHLFVLPVLALVSAVALVVLLLGGVS